MHRKKLKFHLQSKRRLKVIIYRKRKKRCETNILEMNRNMVINLAFVGHKQSSKNAVWSHKEKRPNNKGQRELRAFDKSCIYLLQYELQIMISYKTRLFLITFSSYVGVHALRTTYSFSKGLIAQTVQVEDSQLGIVDSLMLYALALGYLQQAILPFPKPVFALSIGMFLMAFFFVLIPIFLNMFVAQSFAILCVLMCFDGYFQSYAWPNLLMLVNSQYNNKEQSLQLGIWSTNTNIGNILGFILCQYLVIKQQLGWQSGMYIIGCFIIINDLLVTLFIKQLPKVDHIPPKESLLLSQQDTEIKQNPIAQEKSFQNICKLFKSPLVILMTIIFSLVKSVEYGILLWLPMYFNLIGLVEYSAFIPIAFDCASVISSIALGFAFKMIQNKGLLLAPLIFILMMLFLCLRFIDATVAGYYIMIVGVGLCLGGTYNMLASLVAMQLVKVVDARYRTKYLGFYSAVLMCVANIITATTQILLGFVIGQDQSMIFAIFFWYSTFTFALLIVVTILQRKQNESTQNSSKQKYIEIVQAH